ncbi:MAG TPA: DnaA/Hda family protein [Gemmatimonadaceae bacterium]|nr:DnaA/Hda family protein [Gemmatimonadaceae bacterium]
MRLDQRYRFENLVVGSANRLAVAAARAVAEAPGTVYNPLFVYGGSGLGKTHLLGGISQLAEKLQPNLSVEYVTLVDFVELYHAAVAAGETEAWTSRWQEVNVLLIDDIQFLTGRKETQAELLRLFTSMQQLEHQLVLTSDRAPGEIADVDERLIARLSGGLVVDIGSPDYETRVAILRAVAVERSFDVPVELLDELARIEFSNVRELQGALNRLVAHKSLGSGSLRVQDVARALGLEMTGAAGRKTADDFDSFLADVTTAVQQHVESWKARISEAVAYWAGEGYRTHMLERALSAAKPPNVEGLIDTFVKAIEKLKALEERASGVDPSLGGNAVFRDPEQVAQAEDLVERALAGRLPPSGPSPAFARGLFEVSTSNQLAVKAADAVVQQPGEKFNPLLLHGPTGVGKTHLAHAIGNELTSRGSVVACVPAQRFVDELIAAIGAGTVERWRARYRAADVLILDDVQFLAGKERTQEELFHVFNALHGAGKQLVFTSDMPPRRIPDLEERLRSRFDGGLVAPIDPPDRVLRERIITRTLGNHAHSADADLVRVLAEQSVQNVRELVGLVHRVMAAADAKSVALNGAFARGELGPAARLTPTAARASIRAVDSTFLDSEKVIWEWPEATARLVEELR